MPKTAFNLLPELLPVQDVRVGSLITSIRDPHVDAYLPQSDIETPVSATFLSVSGLVAAAKTHKFNLALTQLLNVHLKPGDSNHARLETKAVRKYEIKAQRETFKQICKEQEAKEWFEDGYAEGGDSFFVVGLMTVLDAEVSE